VDKLIPFNKPYVPDTSKRYAMEALESDHQQGDGPFTARASKMVSDLVGGGHVLLTPSCTHALEMASMLGNFGPGDEVILPSYTFTSAATAITKFGATPVFVDIDPITKGIDANQVAQAVTDKTVAISWVNYAGVAPDIETLQSLARKEGLLLIEDNAHGLGGIYNGKPLGSFGDFATQSFHATKNIQCGEGGALVINNLNFIERAEIIREKGTNRKKFINGEIKKYEWVDYGSSYLLAETLAAILYGQLENFESIQQTRFSQSLNYYEGLKKWANSNSLFMFYNAVAHMFYLEFASAENAKNFQLELKKDGVTVYSHYQPLHSSEAANLLKIKKFNCKISEKISKNLIRLPVWSDQKSYELEIIEKIIKVNLR
jgi:dTDP-4-amino-4,6-dideoxygalactose transaminase